MQSVKGALFLNLAYLLFLGLLFHRFTPAPTTALAPLISMNASLQSHTLDFNIEDLNLM